METMTAWRNIQEWGMFRNKIMHRNNERMENVYKQNQAIKGCALFINVETSTETLKGEECLLTKPSNKRMRNVYKQN